MVALTRDVQVAHILDYTDHNEMFLVEQSLIERIICMAYSLRNKVQCLVQPTRNRYKIHLYADYDETLCQWSTQDRHRIMSLREYLRTGKNKTDVCRNCLNNL